jgi:hypothetical protein
MATLSIRKQHDLLDISLKSDLEARGYKQAISQHPEKLSMFTMANALLWHYCDSVSEEILDHNGSSVVLHTPRFTDDVSYQRYCDALYNNEVNRKGTIEMLLEAAQEEGMDRKGTLEMLHEAARKEEGTEKESVPQGKKRKQVPIACDQCRAAHLACSGEKYCSTCIHRGFECHFTEQNKKPRR